MLDNFRKTDIIWDKSSNKIDRQVRVSSSDERGRKLVVQVLDGHQVKDLTGVNLNLAWETQDRHYQGLDVFTRKDPKNGIFELYYTTGMLSHVGTLKSNLQLVDAVGTVTSEPFDITVFSGMNKEGVQSSDSFSALSKALGYVSDIDGLIGLSQNQHDNIMNEINPLRTSIDSNYAELSGDVSTIRRDQAELRLHVDKQFGELTKDLDEVLAKLTVEIGSNEKGSWIKRPDGSMECTMTATIGGKLDEYGNLFFTFANPRYIEFPQVFQDTPTLSFSTDRYNWFWASSYVSKNGITDLIGYRSYDSLFDSVRVTIKAHGYWNKGGGILTRMAHEEPIVNHWRSHMEKKKIE